MNLLSAGRPLVKSILFDYLQPNPSSIMKGFIMEISTTSIDHLGLVAGIFDKLGIAKVIDRAMPKARKHKQGQASD